MELYGRIAMLPGSYHQGLHGNRQDMCGYQFVRGPSGQIEAVSAVICDGCTQSETSEVGAGLISQMTSRQLVYLVKMHGLDPNLIGQRLYAWVMNAMRNLVVQLPYGPEYLIGLDLERVGGPPMNIDRDQNLVLVYDWIQSNLLFSLVGFYFCDEGVLIVQRGDGGYIVEDKVYTKFYHDVSPYLAYELFPHMALEAGIARLRAQGLVVDIPKPGLEVQYFPKAGSVAIFSDALLDEHGDPRMDMLGEIWDLLDPIKLWEFRRNMLLVKAKQWSYEGRIHDDLTVLAFAREEVMPNDAVLC